MTSENPQAFPNPAKGPYGTPGMTLRDYFAGQALANPAICTGQADERHLIRWFGNRVGIERWEIVARQAGDYADAMIVTRQEPSA